MLRRETAAIFSCICFTIVIAGPIVLVHVNQQSAANLKHFWESTGLCPPEPRSSAPEFLLSKDERFNLALIGSLPHRAISQVRIHWLLDLISASSVDAPHFNFTSLDELLDWMQLFRLEPGFELMGNPSKLFSDFGNDTQVGLWRRLVRELAGRYIDRYGMETVSQWQFETWNEPDLKSYNTFNFTLDTYLQYFTACSSGLQDAGRGQLHLGGPAGLFKAREKHPLCWGLLEHCADQTTCPLDFISFHKKGDGSGTAIVDQGLQLARNISEMFPALRGIALANDEADPLTGWSKSEPWRADVRYASLVASVIAQHQLVMVRQHGFPLKLLSNDNAFLNYHPYYFSQRTLLTRFQMNHTNPPHVQFFKKPVYVTMALLSLLGTRQLDVEILTPDDRLSVLAAGSSGQNPWSGAVLLVFNNDTESDPQQSVNVRLRVHNIRGSSPRFVMYLLNNYLTNPAQVWQQHGSIYFPDFTLRSLIRAAEGPYRAKGPSPVPRSGNLRRIVPLSLPSVGLVHICTKPRLKPGQVTRLLACNVTFNEVLLFWSDAAVNSRCIKTYKVQFSPDGLKSFRRINPVDSIFLSFQYALPHGTNGTEEVRGWYKVRAVDYWDRHGPFSASFQYPSGNVSCP
ncbi:alpha-L-iduronidase isoform X2 [Periplaneta americana]